MTVNITKVKQVFACNGSLYEFDFSFPIDDSDDLKVQVRDVNGIVTELETITQYEISTDAIDYSNGGTITTVSYVSGTRQVYAWPDGSILTAYRETPLIQGSSYKNNRALDQDVLEDDFDKACMQIQELDERLSRAIVVPVDEETESFQLPTKSSRINKYLAFDSDGAPMVSGGIASVSVSSFMEPVVQVASAAAARTLLDAKGIHDNVKTVLDTYTALTTDETLLCSNAAGFTVTLFTAVGNAGKRLNIVNTGTGAITIDGNGDETIGGVATKTLYFNRDVIEIESDGANWQVLSHSASHLISIIGVPFGAEMLWPTETPPTGWLEENGASLVRATYPNLFAVIGAMYGAADDTHFNLPDMRGKFPRIWAHGQTTDPDKATRTAPTAPGATISAGDHVGTEQADAFKLHKHHTGAQLLLNASLGNITGFTASGSSGNTGETGGSETRPINTYRMMIIKAY